MKIILESPVNKYYVQTLAMIFFPGERFGQKDSDEIDVDEPVLYVRSEEFINDFISEVTGEYFTIAVKGSAQYYGMNFEQYGAINVTEYTTSVADTVETDRVHMYGFADESLFASKFYLRRGGNVTGSKIVSLDGSMVYSVKPTSSSCFMKFLNTLNYDATDTTGKTFVYTFICLYIPKYFINRHG